MRPAQPSSGVPHPHQPELPQDTRKQREVLERADSLVTPALLIRLYGPRGALPASSGQLRPPSCSRAHRSHLQRWRPGRNSENRGSRCRNPKVTMGPREGRLASSPRADGSEPGATLLWASGSYFVARLTLFSFTWPECSHVDMM